MSLDPQLRRQMAQTINVAPASGVSGSGQPSYGAAVPQAARVEPERKVINKPNGDAVETTHRIYTETVVRITDRLWLPGDLPTNPSLARTPIGVDAITGETGGVDHFEVTI